MPPTDYTNLAYLPALQGLNSWAPQGPLPTVATPDTARAGIDPFLGTGWDRWFDMAGASDPGGIKLKGARGFPSSPVSGLQQAAPAPGISTDDLIAQSQASRARGAALRQQQYPTIAGNPTGTSGAGAN